MDISPASLWVLSNLVLNFDPEGTYTYRINTGMPDKVTSDEEAFARIFYNVERLGVPIYHDMVLAMIIFSRGDKFACLRYISSITAQLRLALGAYFTNLHGQTIAHSVWLSHVQGFYAWGVPLFQALDGFLGMEQYLSPRDQERNIPARQRSFCKALAEHSFRRMLSEKPKDETDVRIGAELNEIAKRLRMFRQVHRTTAKTYLSRPISL
ncbi:hypothetical protein BCR34DRAFT_609764 [Clohesyomyces aquaticus]|uniref:Uncharacterized protein n=1 Tax=Clohesyomyces aquaticus TaxID=1231657 RepID=A0A1Y2A9I6_9PLEO|nr:hypothetical protein BCR34DRAFT_609764 [Clohesyomyces aquaticus]